GNRSWTAGAPGERGSGDGDLWCRSHTPHTGSAYGRAPEAEHRSVYMRMREHTRQMPHRRPQVRDQPAARPTSRSGHRREAVNGTLLSSSQASVVRGGVRDEVIARPNVAAYQLSPTFIRDSCSDFNWDYLLTVPAPHVPDAVITLGPSRQGGVGRAEPLLGCRGQQFNSRAEGQRVVRKAGHVFTLGGGQRS